MDVLDGDDVRLSSRGRYAERDIVQVRALWPLLAVSDVLVMQSIRVQFDIVSRHCSRS